MNVKKILITMFLSCCFGLLLFAGCTEESSVQSIALKKYSAEAPLEISIGEFPYEAQTLVITHDNGEKQEIVLTEDMISETDKLKFYQEGQANVTISYEGVTTQIAINVSRKVFDDSVQLPSVTKTYTGEEFKVEVEGKVPSGAKIIYPQGNTFTNVGAYDITAIVQCDGYVSKTLTSRIIVEKADYDLSNALMLDKTVVYNREEHAIALQGKQALIDVLPAGVNVSYTVQKTHDGTGAVVEQQSFTGNKAVEAGTYKVTAHFSGDDFNYNPIADCSATLTIERAKLDMSNVVFEDLTVDYIGEAYALAINPDSNLNSDIEISYEIKKVRTEEGVDVSEQNKFTIGNSATEAGVYLVRANFVVTGRMAINYVAEPTYLEARLTINANE